MKAALSKLLTGDSGATVIEYGLIALLIAVTIITAVSALGNEYGLIASLIALAIIGGAAAVGDKLSTDFNELSSNL